MSRTIPCAASWLIAAATGFCPPPAKAPPPPAPVAMDFSQPAIRLFPAPVVRYPPHPQLSARKSLPSRRFLVTAYCPCRRCCGKIDRRTASGRIARSGRTVAADPALMPFGTRLAIEGLGERVVEDGGGAIQGHRLDVFFASHQEARAFGRRWLEVKVVER